MAGQAKRIAKHGRPRRKVKNKRDLMLRVAARDGAFVCAWCGTNLAEGDEPPTLEHVKPHARKGRNRLSNLILACRACNHARGALPAWFWLKRCEERGLNVQREIIAAAISRMQSLGAKAIDLCPVATVRAEARDDA